MKNETYRSAREFRKYVCSLPQFTYSKITKIGSFSMQQPSNRTTLTCGSNDFITYFQIEINFKWINNLQHFVDEMTITQHVFVFFFHFIDRHYLGSGDWQRFWRFQVEINNIETRLLRFGRYTIVFIVKANKVLWMPLIIHDALTVVTCIFSEDERLTRRAHCLFV